MLWIRTHLALDPNPHLFDPRIQIPTYLVLGSILTWPSNLNPHLFGPDPHFENSSDLDIKIFMSRQGRMYVICIELVLDGFSGTGAQVWS